jgi:hypothetical protein
MLPAHGWSGPQNGSCNVILKRLCRSRDSHDADDPTILSEDADRLAALWDASWRSTGFQASTQIVAADLRQRVGEELSAGWEVFVAEYEGALLGFVALRGPADAWTNCSSPPMPKGWASGRSSLTWRGR